MAAYFRMSEALWDCECMQSLMQCDGKDAMGLMRVAIFIRVLTFALYPSKVFSTADKLAKAIGGSPKQVQKVWECCMQFNVLRPSGHGYSAREWLIENEFLGRYEKPSTEQPEAEPRQQPKPARQKNGLELAIERWKNGQTHDNSGNL